MEPKRNKVGDTVSVKRLNTGDIIQPGDGRVTISLGATGNYVAGPGARSLEEAMGTPVREGEWFERQVTAEGVFRNVIVGEESTPSGG